MDTLALAAELRRKGEPFALATVTWRRGPSSGKGGAKAVIRPDGSGERRLTETPANDVYPDWSPDGSSIAYCTIDAGRAFIHIMPAEGGTPSLWREDACLAKWSSDGEHLAYVSSARGRPERLWVAGIDGSDVTEIPSVGQRSVELRDE